MRSASAPHENVFRHKKRSNHGGVATEWARTVTGCSALFRTDCPTHSGVSRSTPQRSAGHARARSASSAKAAADTTCVTPPPEAAWTRLRVSPPFRVMASASAAHAVGDSVVHGRMHTTQPANKLLLLTLGACAAASGRRMAAEQQREASSTAGVFVLVASDESRAAALCFDHL